MNERNPTGYKGVALEPCGRFRAQGRLDGTNKYIGTFDTAVAAAVAYARFVQPAEAAAAAEEGTDENGVDEDGGGGEERVTEAEGMTLCMSSSNPTGYMGVETCKSGKFRAAHRGNKLGTFDTVVPILTSSSGSGTVILAGTATIQNVFIANTGGGAGLVASYGADSNFMIRSSTIGGGTGAYAVDVATTAGNSVAICMEAAVNDEMRAAYGPCIFAFLCAPREDLA